MAYILRGGVKAWLAAYRDEEDLVDYDNETPLVVESSTS